MADINEERLGPLRRLKGIPRGTRSAVVIPTDVTSAADRQRLIDETLEHFGRIDILVNNAAIVDFGENVHLNPSEEETRKVWETNYHAPRLLSHQVAEIMVRQGNGGIIENIASVHGKLVRMQEHYSAAKAALVMLTKEMAVQYGPYGIRVNAIAPGAINTAEDPQEEDPAMATDFKNSIILGRRGKPEEVAKMAVVLASDYWSSYVTGATFYVSAGLELSNWVTRQYLPK